MKLKVGMAIIFIGIALFMMTGQAQAAWSWIAVPHMDYLWSRHSVSSSWKSYGSPCDDYYSQWTNVPQNQIIPSNLLGVHATNLVTDGAMAWHQTVDGWGATGYFECINGMCKVKLCTTDNPGADPNSAKLGSW